LQVLYALGDYTSGLQLAEHLLTIDPGNRKALLLKAQTISETAQDEYISWMWLEIRAVLTD
jgi:hypothetical protein